MKRRNFLSGLGAFALSSWVVESFAVADKLVGPAHKHRVPLLFSSYRLARRSGKPLLILMIPADDSEKHARGQLWGAFLNHATNRQLAPLAQCEVVCATAAELDKLVPGAGKGHPLAVLIETNALPAASEAVHVKLPPMIPMDWANFEESQAKVEARVDERNAKVASALEHSITPNGSVAARRAAESAAAGGKTAEAATLITAVRAGEAVDSKLVDRYSAECMQALLASSNRKESRRLAAQLAKVVRRELKDRRVPGSRWANSGGCGTTIEGEDSNIAVGCGMGHVPAKSQRFLYFFAKGPYES